jgi:hypothetical protein
MRRLLFFALALTLVACDPVHADAVDALGDETPGVRKGPLHRPGQPCIVCHDGALRDPPAFSVAGTIFVDADSLVAADGATVTLTDSDEKTIDLTTNQAGNFYASPSQFTPTYPMTVEVRYRGVRVPMTSKIGRDGSCGGCHTDPAGPTSPGHIYIPPDGGTP